MLTTSPAAVEEQVGIGYLFGWSLWCLRCHFFTTHFSNAKAFHKGFNPCEQEHTNDNEADDLWFRHHQNPHSHKRSQHKSYDGRHRHKGNHAALIEIRSRPPRCL